MRPYLLALLAVAPSCVLLACAGLWRNTRSEPPPPVAVEYVVHTASDHLYCHRETPTSFKCAPLTEFLKALDLVDAPTAEHPL